MKCQKTRIGPLHFQARCHRRRLNLALVFCVYFHCSTFLLIGECELLCVRFSFSITSQEIDLLSVFEMIYFVSSGT